MSIERLKKVSDNYFYKCQSALNISKFMQEAIDTFKYQSAQIAELKSKVKKLEQEGSYFDRVKNIKEVQNLY